EQIAGGYPSRERFLTDLTLDPPEATSDQAGRPLLDQDYLILSTVHSAKGQERNGVCSMPPMTRARDSLHLLAPQRFFTHGQSSLGDRHVYAARTRFLPATLLHLFECSSRPAVAVDAKESAEARQVRIDVGARMRSMRR